MEVRYPRGRGQRRGDRGLERSALRGLDQVPRAWSRTDLREHGENAIRLTPPAVGDRVLDIGCGLGDTTTRLAELVGEDGSAHGVDVAERMIETAIEEAREQRSAERHLRGPGRGDGALRPGVRLRLRAVRHDVLREPRRGASQRPPGARARRRPEHGGLAPQARQRRDAPGRARGCRVPRGA